MSRTLLQAINTGLRAMGEPAISALTSDDILEAELIEAVNHGVREIQNRYRFDWTFRRSTLQTTDDITTGYVAATNGSTSINSVDSDGDNATNWGSLEAGMYIRIGTDQVSYKLSSVATVTTPHSAVLETAYVGTTTTASTYVALKDEYSITTSNFGDIERVAFTDSSLLGGFGEEDEIDVVPFAVLFRMADGDFHRDTSGKPRAMARIGVDSSDYPVYKLWPYPTDEYILEIWDNQVYTALSAITDSVFSGDAPEIAYDIVDFYVKARAYEWDNNIQEKNACVAQAMAKLNSLITREHKQKRQQLSVKTYRRRYATRVRAVSQIGFDTGDG